MDLEKCRAELKEMKLRLIDLEEKLKNMIDELERIEVFDK